MRRCAGGAPMRLIARLELALALFTVFAAGLGAQSKHTPSLEESLELKTLSGARISPDGRFIAYRVRETDWKENAYLRQIWLVRVATGESIQLTRGKKSSDAPEWSPNGQWLAFITEREPNAILPEEQKDVKKEDKTDEKKEEKKGAGSGDGKPAARQIWLISPQGGEAWQLTQHPTDIGSFHWSKDGKQIAFTAAAAESKAEKDRKEKFSDYEVVEQDFKQNQLWTVDVAAAEVKFLPQKARQITRDSSLNVSGFSWSPDSNRIAFSATHSPLLAFAGDEDIYLVDLAHDNAVQPIVTLEGP